MRVSLIVYAKVFSQLSVSAHTHTRARVQIVDKFHL